ncbi:MAG TPA: MFS transporter, partial [Lactococcus sp.]|nr:MFS transporter [Lactococcus sp.]
AAIPFVMISDTTPVWLLTIAYMVRMIGNAPDEISHATALNNSLRQAFGASAITVLIVLADIPSNFVTGMRLAMWATIFIVVLMLSFFGLYLRQSSRKDA